MTLDQWITAGIPLSAVLLGILRNEFATNNLSARMGETERHVFSRVDSLEKVMGAKFEAQTQALLRVEQVLDARLKHLEEVR
jgi:hypothetical protein